MNPWQNEPSRLDFESDGLPCAMRRGPLGCWCGYVGIPPEHPWFGLPFNTLIKPTVDMMEKRSLDDLGVADLFLAAISGKDANEELPISLALRVHGGITYSGDSVARESDGLQGFWWFGFDCGHAGDLVPMLAYRERDFGFRIPGVYRDQQYVVSECQQLAAQLVKIGQQPAIVSSISNGGDA